MSEPDSNPAEVTGPTGDEASSPLMAGPDTTDSSDSTDREQRRSDRYAELRAMETAYAALEPLSEEGQDRAFKWLMEALGFANGLVAGGLDEPAISADGAPAGREALSPREFISEKKPNSSVERVACLAYYLAHFRGLHHFKTPDIVALNTEAASHKFTNPSRDVDNADRKNGYIVSAGGGAKQITVRGEALVRALPDPAAVTAALQEHPHRQRRSAASGRKATTQAREEK